MIFGNLPARRSKFTRSGRWASRSSHGWEEMMMMMRDRQIRPSPWRINIRVSYSRYFTIMITRPLYKQQFSSNVLSRGHACCCRRTRMADTTYNRSYFTINIQVNDPHWQQTNEKAKWQRRRELFLICFLLFVGLLSIHETSLIPFERFFRGAHLVRQIRGWELRESWLTDVFLTLLVLFQISDPN